MEKNDEGIDDDNDKTLRILNKDLLILPSHDKLVDLRENDRLVIITRRVNEIKDYEIKDYEIYESEVGGTENRKPSKTTNGKNNQVAPDTATINHRNFQLLDVVDS